MMNLIISLKLPYPSFSYTINNFADHQNCSSRFQMLMKHTELWPLKVRKLFDHDMTTNFISFPIDSFIRILVEMSTNKYELKVNLDKNISN